MPTIIKQQKWGNLEIDYSQDKSRIIICQEEWEESICVELSTIPNLIKVLEKYKEVK